MNDQSDPLARFRSNRTAPVTEEDGKRHIVRDGRRIEVDTVEVPVPPKHRRQEFKEKHVQFPARWGDALRAARAGGSTWALAYVILAETHKCKYLGGEVILSSEVTGMPQTSRRRATRELQRLGLIQIAQRGYESPIALILQ